MPTLDGKPWGKQPPAGERQITEHFYWSEAVCRCCGCVVDWASTRLTAEMMEQIREYLGGQVLHCNSWVRCPQHNLRIGGAAQSYHVRGMAVDFTARHLKPSRVQQLLRQIQGKGKIVGGLGSYGSFTHADHGPARRWRGT